MNRKIRRFISESFTLKACQNISPIYYGLFDVIMKFRFLYIRKSIISTVVMRHIHRHVCEPNIHQNRLCLFPNIPFLCQTISEKKKRAKEYVAKRTLLSQYIEIAIQTRQVLSLGLENKNNTSEKGIRYCAHIRQRKFPIMIPSLKSTTYLQVQTCIAIVYRPLGKCLYRYHNKAITKSYANVPDTFIIIRNL